MMLHIPEVLTKAQVAELRRVIDAGDWVDGNATSGTQSALAKRNEQLPEGSEAARYAGEKILDALSRSPLFVTAALPQTQVVDGKLARVLSWYDNEWGFATRMSDTALQMAKFL